MEFSLFLSALHPRLVQFPIVLLMTALFMDVAGLAFHNERAHWAGKLLMWLGTAMLLLAFICGISSEIWAGRAGVPHFEIELHELAATVASWCFIGLAAWRIFLEGKQRKAMMVFLVLGFSLYAMLALTGYLGGKLVADYGAWVSGARANTFLSLHDLNTLAQRQTDMNLRYSDIMHRAAGCFVLLLTISVFVRELWPKHAGKVRWVMPALLAGGGVLLFFFADLDLYELTDPRQFYDREVQAHKLIAIILFVAGVRGIFKKKGKTASKSLGNDPRLQNRLIAILALIGGGLLFTHVHTVAPYANVAAGVYINHIVMGFVALVIGMVKLTDEVMAKKRKALALVFPLLMTLESFLLLTYTEGIPWWAGIGHYNRWGMHGGTIAPYGKERAELVFHNEDASVDVYIFERFADKPVAIAATQLTLLVSQRYQETAVPLDAVDPVNDTASHYRGRAVFLKDDWQFHARLPLPLRGRERMGYFDPWVTPLITGIPPNQVARFVCPMHEGMRAIEDGECPLCHMSLVPVNNQISSELHNSKYAMTLTHNPKSIDPHAQVQLRFTPQRVANGSTLQDLTVIHEHLMHLIVVSQDLSYFDHVHPARQPDGSFTIDYRFPHAGEFLLFSDISPRQERPQVFRLALSVRGNAPDALDLTASRALAREVGPYHVELILQPRKFVAEREALMGFRLSRDGKPVTDLHPYIGAMGHCVIVSKDTQTYLHSHPEQITAAPLPDARGGPEVSFHTIFPKPGRYKIWGQFKRGEEIIIADFVVDVKPALLSKGLASFLFFD